MKNYWNEEVETLSPPALRRREGRLLHNHIDYVYRSSAFYRHKLDEARVRPQAITCQESLAEVPFTEKSELAEAQRRGELIGGHLAAPFEAVVRIVGTGGTSGKPLRIAWTRADVSSYNEMGARALWTMGCRPGDLVVNCFNYSIYAGGVMDHMAFEALGAAVLAYGVGRSRELLDLLADIPGDLCLYSTPSYAVRLDDIATSSGIDLRSLGVRKGFFSGEAGLQVAAYRSRIEDAWGLAAADLYGVAELGCQSGECEHRSGLHYCGGGLVIAELINPDSGTVEPMVAGATGELVFTTLQREACPLLRFRSHDYVRVQTERCACGRTSPRFTTLGRSDDMFVVKGVNVFPTGIQEIVVGLRPRLTGEFQIVLDRPPPFDYAPRLRVEVARERNLDQDSALAIEVAGVVRRRAGISVTVELVDQGSIASEHKTRRLVRGY